MRHLSIFFGLSAGVLAASTAATAEPRQTAAEIAGPAHLDRDKLTHNIETILAKHQVAGAHVVVTFGPDTVLSRAYGTDPSTGETFEADTVVRLASASKLMTAITIASLVESGDLDLEATLGDIDPSLPRKWQDVPVWRVLNHTSGLPMIVSRPEFGAMNDDRLSRFSMDDLSAIIGSEDLDFAPGDRWRYQQSGYAILTHALATRAGTSWAAIVEKTLLQPASLAGTGIGNDAAVFEMRDGKFTRHISNYPAFFAPAGGFQTTGEDTRKLLLALTNGSLINEDSLRALVNDQRRLEQLGRDAEGEGYGLGVAVQRFGDVAFFGHSGGGGLADIRFAPERQVGIAVVTNRAGGTGAAIEIGDLIASTLFGPPHEASESS